MTARYDHTLTMYFSPYAISFTDAVRRWRIAVAAFAVMFSIAHVPPPTWTPQTVRVLAEVQPSAIGHITLEAYLARIAANRRA